MGASVHSITRFGLILFLEELRFNRYFTVEIPVAT